MRSISFNPLWKKLIDLRMTKAEMADKSGISRSTLARLRKDEPVNLDIILKICNALDVGVDDVLEIR